MNEPEEWRAIPGFAAYEASDLGRVRRVQAGRVLSPGSAGAYVHVSVKSDDGKRCTRGVHCLVALAFLGPRPVGFFTSMEGRIPYKYHVNHRDHDGANNRLTNLEYCSPRGNVMHGRMIRSGELPLGASAEDAFALERRRWYEASRCGRCTEDGLTNRKCCDWCEFETRLCDAHREHLEADFALHRCAAAVAA